MMRSFFWPEASFSSERSCSRQLIEVDLLEQLLDGLGAHAGLEVVLILFAHVAVFFFGEDLVLDQRAVAGIGDDIAGEVENLLQDARADVEQQAHAGRECP